MDGEIHGARTKNKIMMDGETSRNLKITAMDGEIIMDGQQKTTVGVNLKRQTTAVGEKRTADGESQISQMVDGEITKMLQSLSKLGNKITLMMAGATQAHSRIRPIMIQIKIQKRRKIRMMDGDNVTTQTTGGVSKSRTRIMDGDQDGDPMITAYFTFN